jgi:hypothetical protein
MGWVTYILCCMVPPELVVCVLWGSKGPECVEKLGQPAKGILLTLFVAVAGLLIATCAFYTAGGGFGPPTPMLVQYVILVVPVFFLNLFMFHGWPFILIKNRFAAGLLLIPGLYVIGYLLFRILFNYAFLAGAPVYVASLDPHGLLNAWLALTFFIGVVVGLFMTLLFDLWPMTLSPRVMRPSVLPIVWTLLNIAISSALLGVFLVWLKMDVVVIMVRLMIAFLFGAILLLIMFQGSLFSRLKQPVKGIVNVAVSAVVGLALCNLYALLAPHLGAPLPPGPPQYGLELWLASSLLAVSFPVLSGVSGMFEFWPFVRAARPESK